MTIRLSGRSVARTARHEHTLPGKANLLVNHTAIDDSDLIFKREGGGFTRLDKMFNG